eukprot:763917-Hanusia_phi.AAC.2
MIFYHSYGLNGSELGVEKVRVRVHDPAIEVIEIEAALPRSAVGVELGRKTNRVYNTEVKSFLEFDCQQTSDREHQSRYGRNRHGRYAETTNFGTSPGSFKLAAAHFQVEIRSEYGTTVPNQGHSGAAILNPTALKLTQPGKLKAGPGPQWPGRRAGCLSPEYLP